MKNSTRLFVAALALAIAPAALAQAWPAKPVRVIVNFAPGGTLDLITRPLGAKLGEALGQPFVVENRAGANGSIGLEAVARSAPDGYTLLSSAGSPLVINPHLYKQPVDPAKDILPVAPTARVSVFLVVRPALEVRTVAELVARAKANPGKLSFGSPGSGSTPHIAGEMLLRAAQIRATHVPYKGAGPALTDLLGGQIDFMFDPGPGVPQVRAEKLRLLAIATGARHSAFPDAPTLTEAGYAIDVDTLFGIHAPAGTPRDIVQRLNREIARAIQTPELRTALANIAAEVMIATPEEFAARLQSDRERFGAVVREANIRVD